MTALQGFVQNGPARIWTWTKGRGPALVFCEGGPGLCEYIAPLDERLAEFCSLYQFHQRGVGLSSPVTDYRMDAYLADLEAVRTHYGVERWVVCGHSWGAAVALNYAAAHPERTLGLLYLSGVGLDPAWHEAYREARRARLGDAFPRYEELRARAENAQGGELEELRRTLVELVRPTDYSNRQNAAKAIPYKYPINYEANAKAGSLATAMRSAQELLVALGQLHVPALFLHGADDPRPGKFVRALSEKLPYARYLEIPGAGHFPWLEQEAPCLAAIQDFIREAAGPQAR